MISIKQSKENSSFLRSLDSQGLNADPARGEAPSPHRKPGKLLIALILLFLFCNLPGAALAQGQPVDGGSIVFGSIGDATSLIPRITSDTASSDVQRYLYNGLVKYDKDLKLVGDLAESWEISPDGLSITFHLKKGVKFHDGHEYTSKDAMFSYEFMVDPKTPTPYAGDYLKVKKAEAPDPYTFKVTYGEVFAPGLASWGMPQLPSHLLKGKDIRESPLNRNPIGTGPYRFDSWQQGSRITLKVFKDYFEGRAHLDKITFRVIPDMATLFLELRAGGIDQMGLTALQYQRQTNNAFFKKNFNKFKYLASSYVYLAYNLKDSKFKDVRVRRALTHAINKKEIIKGVLLGMGQPAVSPYKPGTYWYNPNVSKYKYNPKKALQLLAEAGWKDTDNDGILDKNGQPFEFTIITNQGNPYRANSGIIIQQRLAAIGIKVQIRVIEWASFIKEFIDKGRFEATILAWTITPDPDLYDVWHSENAKPGGLNFVSYKCPELDELLTRGRLTFDQAERKAIYDKAQEILARDQPYTFLYDTYALPIVNSRFYNIHPEPAGISYNFIRWFVPKDRQGVKLLP
ncbi:peptide-binding protein [Dethiosulfatarculus sandiegensis]|uniref:Peptide-binding protein n=1 Tax=Dethiosulfatarculus sandiegensis TaxID=1429043 RepID=A0A0D2J1S2_9BACT|nr:peptide-binding protein [Dethiosulfatarculus sandiegensis]KIX12169.1 peptide-binding protein [Dethiosulfatarculus sandiegensis]